MLNTQISIYGLMIAISLIVNIIIVILISFDEKVKKEDILISIIYEFIGIIYGGKILTYLLNFQEVDGKFDFASLGFSSYGGIIGAIVFLSLYCTIFKKNEKEILHIFILPIPLVYAIGKIGCFFAGCCYGIEYSGIGSVIYNYSSVAPNGIKLFPVQAVETIVFFIIFILYMKNRKKLDKTILVIDLIIVCGSAKFILDYFRINHINKIITGNQIISIIFILLALEIKRMRKYNIAKKTRV